MADVIDTTTTTEGNNPAPQGKTYTQEEFEAELAKRVQSETDKRVTQAVATAEARVKAELKDFYAEEAKKSQATSAEDKVNQLLAQHEKQMNERERLANVREAEVMLKEAGFADDEISFYTEDVTHDRDVSLAKITKACNFRKANKQAMEKAFQEKMSAQFGANLQSGNVDVNTLQTQYDNAKKAGRIAEMITIQRTAVEQNITLKQ